MIVKLVAENTFWHINQKRNFLNMKDFQVFDILNSRTFPTRSLKQKIPICKIGLLLGNWWKMFPPNQNQGVGSAQLKILLHIENTIKSDWMRLTYLWRSTSFYASKFKLFHWHCLNLFDISAVNIAHKHCLQWNYFHENLKVAFRNLK